MAIKLTKKEVSERDDLAGNLRQAMEDFESAREVLRAFVEGDTTVPADQTVAYNDQITGAANEALVTFLSRTFGRPRREVRLLSGEKSRDKRVAINGLTEAELAVRLSDILNTQSPE